MRSPFAEGSATRAGASSVLEEPPPCARKRPAPAPTASASTPQRSSGRFPHGGELGHCACLALAVLRSSDEGAATERTLPERDERSSSSESSSSWLPASATS